MISDTENFMSTVTATVESTQGSFADFDHIITSSLPSYTPEPSFFGSGILSATQDVSLSDDERVAVSFAGLNASPESAETPLDSLYDFSSIYFLSPTQYDESPLMGPDDGSKDAVFLAYHLAASSVVGGGEANPASPNTEALYNVKDCWWSGASPTTGSINHDKRTLLTETSFASISPSSTLVEIGDAPSAALPLTSEWLDLFPTPVPCGTSVFQPSPEGFAASDVRSSSSGVDAEGLQSLLDLLPWSQTPLGLGELNVHGCGAKLNQGKVPFHCSSPSSEDGSSAASQVPAPPSPALTLPVTPSASQAPTSPPSGQPSPQTQVIELNEEQPPSTSSNEPPQTFKFVFDLKTFEQEYRCGCKKKTIKKNRHWQSCPSNPNQPRIPCPHCNKSFRGGSAMGNLQKHVKGFHPGKSLPRSRRKGKALW